MQLNFMEIANIVNISKNLFNSMKIKKTNFKDLLVIENQKFVDYRGEFRELIIEKILKLSFLQCNFKIKKKCYSRSTLSTK